METHYETLDLPENSTKEEVFRKFEELSAEYTSSRTPSKNDNKLFKMQNRAFKALNKQFDEMEKQRPCPANQEPINSGNSQTNAPFKKEKSEASVDCLIESLGKMSLENKHENNANETKNNYKNTAQKSNFEEKVIEKGHRKDQKTHAQKDQPLITKQTKAPIQKNVYLSLEEILRGVQKTVTVTRTVIQDDGSEKTHDAQMSLVVPAGVLNGHTIVLEDVHFVVQEKAHPTFKRVNQCDIEYTAMIPQQSEGRQNEEIQIPTLEGDFICLTIDEEITEETIETFTDRGLPKNDKEKTRGSLVVHFKIGTTIEELNVPSSLAVENEQPLELTLEEIFTGCTKEINLQIREFGEQQMMKTVDRTFTVKVAPGTASNERIVFPNEGDQQPSGPPADVVFVVKDRKHQLFERDCSDLLFTAAITKEQLEMGSQIEIPTLESKPKIVTLDEDIASDRCKTFYGAGLPYPSDTKMRGSLVVQFVLVDASQALPSYIPPTKASANVPIAKQEREVDFSNSKSESMIQLPENVYTLPLSLEEIYHGCVKKVPIQRSHYDGKGRKVNEKASTLSVVVKSGSIHGTEIRVKGQGDKQVGKLPANVLFVVCEAEHAIFKRTGLDIEYVAKISAAEAVSGGTVSIPTLSGDPIKYTFSGNKYRKTEKLSGLGIPDINDTGKRGDCLIQFDICDNQQQDPPVEYDLYLTIEQIYRGCQKSIEIERTIIDKKGKSKIEKKKLTVKVKAGTESGTEIPFPREGNQTGDNIPADIIFIAQDKPHGSFRRNGPNLEYSLDVNETDLMNGKTVKIQTLDGVQNYKLDKRSLKSASASLPNLGLPYVNDSSKRGDLILLFNIIKDFKPQDPQIDHDLPLTLDDIYNGVEKRFKITRHLFDEKDNEIVQDETLTIAVPRGTEAGKEFKFEQKGDEYPETIPADVVFTVRDKGNVLFSRNGPNIEYTAYVTATESENGVELEIPTFNGQLLSLPVKEKITDGATKAIKGKGLPFSKDSLHYGDLIVKFKIVENAAKGESILEKVLLTLEEMAKGFRKNYNFKRSVFDVNGKLQNLDEKISFNISPGTKPGKRFKLPRKGNQSEEHLIPGDILFAIEEIPDDTKSSACFPTYATNKESQHKEKPNAPPNLPPLKIPLVVTLEEILIGSNRTETIEREIVCLSDKSRKHVQEEVTVSIPLGAQDDSELPAIFSQQTKVDEYSQDVIFVIKTKPHEHFTRNGDDLVYRTKISKLQFQHGCQLSIPILDKSQDKSQTYISIWVNNKTVKVLPHYGLPTVADPLKRGNLIVPLEVEPEVEGTSRNAPNAQSNIIQVDLELTLEQIFHGCQVHSIDYLDGSSRKTISSFYVTRDIGVGGTIVKKAPHDLTKEVHITVRDKNHEIYIRDGYDLICTKEITAQMAKDGFFLDLPLIDGYVNYKLVNNIKQPLVIENKGLQIPGQNWTRGNVTVYFQVINEPPSAGWTGWVSSWLGNKQTDI